MKTTTKKTSFQSFIPRVVQSEESKSNHQKAIEDTVTSNNTKLKRSDDCTEKETKLKQQKRERKPKNRKDSEVTASSKLPDSVLYPLNKAKQKNANKGNVIDEEHEADIVETYAEPIRKHKEQSNVKVHNKQEKFKRGELISEKKTLDHGGDYPVVSTNDSTKRFLRPRNRDNIVTVNKTQKKLDNQKPMKLKPEKVSKSTRCASEIRKNPSSLKESIPSQIDRPSRKKENIVKVNKTQEKLYSNSKSMKLKPEASHSTRSAATEMCAKPVHRSRSPLKEKSPSRIERLSERALRDDKVKNVTVHLKRIPARGNTRRNAQIKNAVEPVCTSNETNSLLVCNNNETVGMNNAEAKKRIKYKKPTTRKIVIHSPGSTTILGTKIDDTFMLVTKRDYAKHINPRDLGNTNKSILNNSIIPINRRIIYEPPTNIIEDNSGSDCEDVLLTSYTNTGHILHINVN